MLLVSCFAVYAHKKKASFTTDKALGGRYTCANMATLGFSLWLAGYIILLLAYRKNLAITCHVSRSILLTLAFGSWRCYSITCFYLNNCTISVFEQKETVTWLWSKFCSLWVVSIKSQYWDFTHNRLWISTPQSKMFASAVCIHLQHMPVSTTECRKRRIFIHADAISKRITWIWVPVTSYVTWNFHEIFEVIVVSHFQDSDTEQWTEVTSCFVCLY